MRSIKKSNFVGIIAFKRGKKQTGIDIDTAIFLKVKAGT